MVAMSLAHGKVIRCILIYERRPETQSQRKRKREATDMQTGYPSHGFTNALSQIYAHLYLQCLIAFRTQKTFLVTVELQLSG